MIPRPTRPRLAKARLQPPARRAWVVVVVCAVLAQLLTLAAPATAGTLTAPTWTASDLRTGIQGTRYDWGFSTATGATLSSVTATVPTGTSGPNRYGALSGAVANEFIAPQTANQPTGDLDLRVHANLNSWTTLQTLEGKWSGAGSNSYRFNVLASGALRFDWSNDGSTGYTLTSGVTGFAANSDHWVRVLFQPNSSSSAVANFYSSTDGKSWSLFSGPISLAGASSIASTTAPIEIGRLTVSGASPLVGKIYYVDARSGLSPATSSTSTCNSSSTGSTIFSCFDPKGAPVGLSGSTKTWISAAPVSPVETWSISRSGTYPAPADIASDLSVVKATGMPNNGSAYLRQVDGTVTYSFLTPYTETAGTAMALGVAGFTNTYTTGAATSTITTYDNQATPTLSDSSAPTASLTFASPIISTASAKPTVLTAATTATSVDIAVSALNLVGTKIYITDSYASTVIVYDTATGKVSPVAGNGAPGNTGNTGLATAASFKTPTGAVADSQGNVYVVDKGNNLIRKIDHTTLNVSVYAGGGGNTTPTYSGSPTGATLNIPKAIAIDSSGNLYIADQGRNVIRKIDPTGTTMSTVAGNGSSGYSGDGVAISNSLSSPGDMTLDSSGNLYIADTANNRIRKVDTGGNMTTIAGTSAGLSGDGSSASTAQLNSPGGVAIDGSGNIFVADTTNCRIRKFTVGGNISTVAGTSCGYGGDGAGATAALLRQVSRVAVDGSGNVYVADANGDRVRKFTVGGTISTIAGTGVSSLSGDGGNISQAHFFNPQGAVSDGNGNLYIADSSNNAIRKIDKWGTVSTIAGQGPYNAGYSGDNSLAVNAVLNGPRDLKIDSGGTLYFTDANNRALRKIQPNGNIYTILGLATSMYDIAISPLNGNIYATTNCQVLSITTGGSYTVVFNTANTCASGDTGDGGLATAATANLPRGIAFDSLGDLYFTDWAPQRLRMIDPAGYIHTIAGGGASTGNDVVGTQESIGNSDYVSVDAQDNVYLQISNRMYLVNPNGLLRTVAGSGSSGYSGDGGAVTAATFNSMGEAALLNGAVYIPDSQSSVVRKFLDFAPMPVAINADSVSVAKNTPLNISVQSNDWAQEASIDPNSLSVATAPSHGTATVNMTPGSISTVTYTPTSNYTGADSFIYTSCDTTMLSCGTATVSITVGSDQLTTVAGATSDGQSDLIAMLPVDVQRIRNYLFVSDGQYNVIRRIDIYSHQSVVVAGDGAIGVGGNGGPATAGAFHGIAGMAIDPMGNLYVADTGNNQIRTVSTAGTMGLVAGGGATTPTVGGVAALSASLNSPRELTFGLDGSLNMSATAVIYQYRADGKVYVVAGTGTAGFSGDGGTATSAQLNGPSQMALAANGDLYIADKSNHAIRKLSGGVLSTIAGQLGTSGSTGNGGLATAAYLNSPGGIVVESSGAVDVADTGNGVTRRFTPGGTIAAVSGGNVNGVTSLALGTTSDLYMATSNSATRRVYYLSAGTLSTLGGNGYQSLSPSGYSALNSQVFAAWPRGLVVDASNNVYFVDADSLLREIVAASGQVVSPATPVTVADGQISFDSSGRLIYGGGNCSVYRLNADLTSTKLAGTGACATGGLGGLGTSASIGYVNGVAGAPDGSIFVTTGDNYILKIKADLTIVAVAGNGTSSNTGNGGLASSATVTNSLFGAVVDKRGDLFTVDKADCTVREIDLAGYITIVAGTSGCGGAPGDGGLATAGRFNNTGTLAIDPDDNLYVADTSNLAIRKIDAATGIISTVVGNGSSGTIFTDDTTATGSSVAPRSVAVGPNGNLYVMDGVAQRIRMAKSIASVATNNLATASWNVVPAGVGHANLREDLSVTPSAAVASSKMTFALPGGIAGTPSVVSAFGLSGTVSATLTGNVLTVSYPGQTLAPGVPVGVAVEGFTNGGSNGSYGVTAALFDSVGTTGIGWSHANIVKLSNGTGAPSLGEPGYSSVWNKSLTVSNLAAENISVSPLAPAASSAGTRTVGGNLNSSSATGLASQAMTASGPGSVLAPTTASFASGNNLASLGTNRWGLSSSSSTGTNAGALGASVYSGPMLSAQSLATNVSATNVFTLGLAAKVDYLTPAGVYTMGFSVKIAPGT